MHVTKFQGFDMMRFCWTEYTWHVGFGRALSKFSIIRTEFSLWSFSIGKIPTGIKVLNHKRLSTVGSDVFVPKMKFFWPEMTFFDRKRISSFENDFIQAKTSFSVRNDVYNNVYNNGFQPETTF